MYFYILNSPFFSSSFLSLQFFSLFYSFNILFFLSAFFFLLALPTVPVFLVQTTERCSTPVAWITFSNKPQCQVHLSHFEPLLKKKKKEKKRKRKEKKKESEREKKKERGRGSERKRKILTNKQKKIYLYIGKKERNI